MEYEVVLLVVVVGMLIQAVFRGQPICIVQQLVRLVCDVKHISCTWCSLLAGAVIYMVSRNVTVVVSNCHTSEDVHLYSFLTW